MLSRAHVYSPHLGVHSEAAGPITISLQQIGYSVYHLCKLVLLAFMIIHNVLYTLTGFTSDDYFANWFLSCQDNHWIGACVSYWS
jgi:hypothetical protein